jgi:hypothetical protein
MALGHERLDVYRLTIGYIAWVYEKTGKLEGVHRAARDPWLRASQSIPIPIAIAIWMRPSPNNAAVTADASRSPFVFLFQSTPCNLTYSLTAYSLTA